VEIELKEAELNKRTNLHAVPSFLHQQKEEEKSYRLLHKPM
jgi:hypothetical protein